MMSNHPVVLVTGSAKRLGAAMIRRLHANGYNVIIHYRHSKKEALALCDALNASRAHSAITLQTDLAQIDTLPKLIEDAYQAWQRLDVLINNASEFFPTKVGDTTEQQWNNLMNSNLKAPYFLSQAAAPFLQKTKGCIINISDANISAPRKGYPVYCTAKSGLNTLTQALAEELPNIRINAIALGTTLEINKEVAGPEDESKMNTFIDAIEPLIQQKNTGQIIKINAE